jgi:DNA-binding NarL/FixJ family response regulator
MAEAGQVRVAIAEELPLLREGIAALVPGFPSMAVVGTAGDGEAAWQLIRRERPDVVLLDGDLPRLHALEVLRRARRQAPGVRVVFFSARSDRETALSALRGGAAGFLLKSASPVQLRACIERVMEGGLYISPQLDSTGLLAQLAGEPAREPFGSLSARENQVFHLLVHGVRSKEIAACIGVSPKTVATYRASLMRKLDIHDVAGLVRYAVRKGLVKC